MNRAKKAEVGLTMFQRRFRSYAAAHAEKKWFYEVVEGLVRMGGLGDD